MNCLPGLSCYLKWLLYEQINCVECKLNIWPYAPTGTLRADDETVHFFHNCMTMWLVFFCKQLQVTSLLGSSLKSFFLSSAVRLVQSHLYYNPSLISLLLHWKKTQGSCFIASISFWLCSDFSTDLFFGTRRALLVIPLYCIRISVILNRFNSSRMMIGPVGWQRVEAFGNSSNFHHSSFVDNSKWCYTL